VKNLRTSITALEFQRDHMQAPYCWTVRDAGDLDAAQIDLKAAEEPKPTSDNEPATRTLFVFLQQRRKEIFISKDYSFLTLERPWIPWSNVGRETLFELVFQTVVTCLSRSFRTNASRCIRYAGERERSVS